MSLSDGDFITLLENNLLKKRDLIATASDEVERLERSIVEAETNLSDKENKDANDNENNVVSSNSTSSQHKRRFLRKTNIELSSDEESEIDNHLLQSNTINTSLGDDVIDNYEKSNTDWNADDAESSDSFFS